MKKTKFLPNSKVSKHFIFEPTKIAFGWSKWEIKEPNNHYLKVIDLFFLFWCYRISQHVVEVEI